MEGLRCWLSPSRVSKDIGKAGLQDSDDGEFSVQKMRDGVTLDELASHCTENDSWVAVDGRVYDVTSFQHIHPGGATILALAGRDASKTFKAFHGATAKAILPELEVGPLLPPGTNQPEEGSADAELEELRKRLQEEGRFIPSRLYYARKVCELLALWTLSTGMLVKGNGGCLAGIAMAMMWQQGGWLAHDFGHNCLFRRNRDANARLLEALGAGLLGFSPAWWQRKHTFHHAQPNEMKEDGSPIDPDIDTLPLIAWDRAIAASASASSRVFIRRQHLLLVPIMALARLSWLAQSFGSGLSLLSTGKSTKEFLLLAFHHAWSALFPVLLTGDAWSSACFLVCAHAFGGIFLATAFVVSHSGKEVHTGKSGFVASQVATTRNVSASPLVDWFTGGLNKQLEHHLFPSLPRHSLGPASRHLRGMCWRHGLWYDEVGFFHALKLVMSHLKAVADSVAPGS